jgi:D-alanyl-lipoteichoic acid acyltransferase DltB (MBOAT superfamily)
MFFVPVYILILLITILIDYVAAIYIEQTEGRAKKTYLVISIISTCIVLFIFKYFNFFNDNVRLVAQVAHWNYSVQALKILLPIGLSFHTFQSLSYVIEVYRGNQKAEKHFGIYALYVMFYPQLVAGPIERPQNMLHQFHEKHNFDYDNVSYGLKKMLWGYFKKVVIADRLAIYVNAIYNNQSHHNGTSLAVAAIFFTFQVYCDFSGYSDIAIGSARVMGFKLMTNFNRPFFSKSISEFWRRWHISLSTWFNDYLFTPLVVALRESGKFAVVFALLITFFISGLWHGAGWTFIVYGLLHGLAIVYEFLTRKWRKKLFKKSPTVLTEIISIISTFTFASFAFIFFRANTFADALSIINKILFDRGKLFIAEHNWLMVYAGSSVMLLLVVEFIEEYALFGKFSLYNNKNLAIRHLTYCSLVIIILLIGVFDKNQFIYFQF